MRPIRSNISVLAPIVLCLFGTQASGQEPPKKKSGWLLVTAAQKEELHRYAEDFKSYLTVARSARTSTQAVIRMARSAGFSELTNPGQVKPGARLYINGHDRAIVLAVIGSEPMTTGTRIIATHQDSPHIGLKPHPIQPAAEFAMLKTVYYGGIKKYQWSNLPLALIGRIDTAEGKTIDISIGLKPGEPQFVIPDNAPHSDKDLQTRTYTGVLTGEELDPVAGSIPADKSSASAEVIRALTAAYHITEDDLVSAELDLVPAANPADVGVDRGLIGGFGQDDRLCSYCAVRALIDSKGSPNRTSVAYLSNFEEVGSVNNSGAASQFLNDCLARLVGGQVGSGYTDLDLRQTLRGAQVLSADCNDGINPIFPQTSEATNSAKLGYGVAVKLYRQGFNANSEYIARIRGILDSAAIPWQTQTPKVEVGGGGTIGGFLSANNMEVIDIGVPLLSMHSPFEMSSKVDLWNLYRFMRAFTAAP